MDTITIQNLEAQFCIGVPDQERCRPQRLLFTLHLQTDFRRATQTDDLADTIDYSAVAELIRTFGNGRSWKLVEKLGTEMAERLMEQFQPDALKLEIKKFVLPRTEYVALTFERPRKRRNR